MDDVEKGLRERLAKVAHLIWDDGLVTGTSGNISMRVPGTSRCIIKPSGFRMCELKPEDFIVVDIYTREVLEGEHKPSIETPFHTTMYRIRPDVGGVVHTHSHFATVFGIAGIELVPMGMILYTAPKLAKGIGIAEYADPGTEQLALNIGAALGERYAVLMPHHGVITVGKDVEEAYTNAKAVEELAKLQYEVMQIGKPQPLPEKTIKKFLETTETKGP
ncbi:MAG: class II aldolase/adducin family protein [Nitrososphaeria archaeon]